MNLKFSIIDIQINNVTQNKKFMEKTNNELLLMIALAKQVIDDHEMLVRQNEKLKSIQNVLQQIVNKDKKLG